MAEGDKVTREETKKAENPEVIKRVSLNIIEPALQKALGKARTEATDQEVISALANCYGGLLVDLLGRDAAAAFLQNHAAHIISREENVLNS